MIATNLVLEPPPVGDGSPSRPVAAWFATGGGIIYQVIENNMRRSCAGTILTSGTTTAFASPDDSGRSP